MPGPLDGFTWRLRKTEPPVYRATSLGAACAGIDRLPVAVFLDNVRSLYSVGSFFRTCDAVEGR